MKRINNEGFIKIGFNQSLLVKILVINFFFISCIHFAGAQANKTTGHSKEDEDSVKEAHYLVSAEYDSKVDIFGNFAPTNPAAFINTFEYRAKSGFIAGLATYSQTKSKGLIGELDPKIGWKGNFLKNGDWEISYTRFIITGTPGAGNIHGLLPNGFEGSVDYDFNFLFTSLTADYMEGAKYPGFDFYADWQLSKEFYVVNAIDSFFNVTISVDNDIVDGHISSVFFFAQKGREKIEKKTDVIDQSYGGLLEDVISVPVKITAGVFSIAPQANYVIGFHQFPFTYTPKKTTYLDDKPFFFFSCIAELYF